MLVSKPHGKSARVSQAEEGGVHCIHLAQRYRTHSDLSSQESVRRMVPYLDQLISSDELFGSGPILLTTQDTLYIFVYAKIIC
jgi:hypothetical protein